MRDGALMETNGPRMYAALPKQWNETRTVYMILPYTVIIYMTNVYIFVHNVSSFSWCKMAKLHAVCSTRYDVFKFDGSFSVTSDMVLEHEEPEY